MGAYEGAGNPWVAGMAYVCGRDAGDDWVERQVIASDDGRIGDRFANGVGVRGGVIVVGAPTHGDSSAGAAYVFEPSCGPDFNHDGSLDTRDVIAFLNAWTDGDASADFDGSGVIDSRDVLAFLNAFVAGC